MRSLCARVRSVPQWRLVMASITCYNQSAVRFVIPSRRRCDAPISSKSRLIRALYALYAAARSKLRRQEITSRCYLALAKKGTRSCACAAPLPSDSHQNRPSFPRSAPRGRRTAVARSLALPKEREMRFSPFVTRFTQALFPIVFRPRVGRDERQKEKERETVEQVNPVPAKRAAFPSERVISE